MQVWNKYVRWVVQSEVLLYNIIQVGKLCWHYAM